MKEPSVKKKKKKLNQQSTFLLIGLAITIFMLGIYITGLTNVFENNTEDWRLKAFRHTPNHSIAMVAINEDDMKKFGKWPWSRNIHAGLLEKISAQKPKVIGLDIMFADPDPGDIEGNKHLVDITKKAGNIIYPVYADPLNLDAVNGTVTNLGGYLLPLQELTMNAVGIGHDDILPDPDGKVRSIILKIYKDNLNVEAFPMALTKEFLDISEPGKVTGNYFSFGKTSIPINVMGQMTLVFAGPPGTFHSYSYSDVLDGKIPADTFKNKIVIIGSKTPGVGNFYSFPLSSASISQVEVFANTVDTLLNGNFFSHSAPLVNIIIILLLGIIASWLFIKGNPIRNLAFLAVLLGIYVGMGYLICLKYHLLVNIIVPSFTIVFCYLGNIAYGIIAERRERMKITQTFGRYVAPQVVDEILRSGDELLNMEGRMQHVSVLFVDVTSFTSISEKLAPIQVVKILNRYFKEVIEAVYMYEGTVDKFIGDAVMVVFNAPLPIDRHEEKAVRAGLEIQKRLAAISDDIEKEFGIPLRASLGINTGDAIIGNIGAMNRVEYATIGDTVNATARLETLAGPEQVYISGTTYEPIKDIVKANYIGPQKVKGKAEQVEVYEVLGFIS